MANVITNAGLAIVTNLISGLGGTVPKYLSWGTGGGTAGITDTTLFTESMSTSNDGTHNTRVTGTPTRVTVTHTNDTFQVAGTLVLDAGKTITNLGLFDTIGTAADLSTAPSGGNLYVKTDFTGLALLTGDSIAATLQITYS